jgi:pilus assembly protein CpaF
MLHIQIQAPDGNVRHLQVTEGCVIGRSAQNEIYLDSWRVAKEHARLFMVSAGVFVEDLGAFGGVLVNGRRIETQHGPLAANDVIGVGAFKLRVQALGGPERVQSAHPQSRSDTAQRRNQAATEDIQASRRRAERAQLEVLRQGGAQEGGAALVLVADPGRAQREFQWRKRLHAQLLETMDLRRRDVHGMSDDQLRQETRALIDQILCDVQAELPADIDAKVLSQQVLDEAIGLGPLEELLANDEVSEIMVNRFDEIYVERNGRLQRYPLTFTGDDAVMGVIERIVAPLGRRIDESSPMVDARLKDGSRVNAIIPPLALKGPCLTIRKFARQKLTALDLVGFDAISAAMAEFLEVCVAARKNIIVSGGTGSGKTTLLNILSNFIPLGERIITVEDAAELQLSHEHWVSLESRPGNVEGRGAVAIRELVRNTLRMRPDRIVVGECRGAEALDMLQAMNTGHEGSLTTLHANTPRDALARLETMILMAGMELPLAAIREQIASAVQVIVQQTRFACGSRKVTSITEVTGIESGKVQIQELFKFVNQGYSQSQGGSGRVQGVFTACDLIPSFYDELRSMGSPLDLGIFKPLELMP